MTAAEARRYWEKYGETLRGFHLRVPMRRRGGNSFYRDKSQRPVQTLCGAPVGDHDAPETIASTKLHGPYALAYCCPACAAAYRAKHPAAGE